MLHCLELRHSSGPSSPILDLSEFLTTFRCCEKGSRGLRMQSRRAITFVEVLIVTAVIGILAALVFLASAPARESARQVACSANLRQIYQAIQMYTIDNPGGTRIPGSELAIPGPTLKTLQPYLTSFEPLNCPDFPSRYRHPWGSSYVWQILSFSETMKLDKDWYEARVAELERQGSQYPIVYCGMHDVMFYFPREKDELTSQRRTFTIELRIDGSIWKGRTGRPRILPDKYPF